MCEECLSLNLTFFFGVKKSDIFREYSLIHILVIDFSCDATYSSLSSNEAERGSLKEKPFSIFQWLPLTRVQSLSQPLISPPDFSVLQLSMRPVLLDKCSLLLFL